MKLFSIVIPSYNQADYLRLTLESLRRSNRALYEVLVLDGGSTDGSVDILKNEAPNLDFWVSERDGGQSAAINRGWRMATGRYVTWLNSDDLITARGLDDLAVFIERRDNPDWVVTNSVWISAAGKILRCVRGSNYNEADRARGLMNVGGPSSFVRRDLLDRVGVLKENFHYMMDTEYWYRLAGHGIKFTRFHRYFWALRLHPRAKMSGHLFSESETSSAAHESWKVKRAEHESIRQLYFPFARENCWERAAFRFGRLARFETPLAIMETVRLRGRDFS